MSELVRRIAVGVVVERRKATSQWADFLWRPVAVLAGSPDTVAWTPLGEKADTITYYAGAAEIALHKSEAENYRRNLISGAPAIWVTIHATGGEPPYVIGGVTADPAEGEGWTEPGQAIVEAVAMPESVREEIAAFIAQYPAHPGFVKRQRDRADPEDLARQARQFGKRDASKTSRTAPVSRSPIVPATCSCCAAPGWSRADARASEYSIGSPARTP
jgi:hypothetical protein